MPSASDTRTRRPSTLLSTAATAERPNGPIPASPRRPSVAPRRRRSWIRRSPRPERSRASPKPRSCSSADAAHRVGLRALLSLRHLELDALAFFERLVTIHLDGAVVNEDVATAVDGDEAEALLRVEPLDCALCHNDPTLLDPRPEPIVGAQPHRGGVVCAERYTRKCRFAGGRRNASG